MFVSVFMCLFVFLSDILSFALYTGKDTWILFVLGHFK